MMIVGGPAMIREQGLHPWLKRTLRPDAHERSLAPVLIQVPLVPVLTRVTGRPAARPSARPRRRLRREVRVAGYAALAALPVFLLALGFWEGRRSATLGSVQPPSEPGGLQRPPVISISIEPVGLTPTFDPEPPVVFPGYLLPDDGSEEPVHAGS